jgi:hypothetical protein
MPQSGRHWQLEIGMDAELSPRDIQSRVRRGEDPLDIAAAAGVPAERVERYARPILGERAHIVALARGSALDPGALDGGTTLAQRADEALTTLGAQDVDWDSHRDDDGRWNVHVTFTRDNAERVASWWFDPATRSLSAADAEAVAIEEPGGDVLPLTRKRPAVAKPKAAEPPAAEAIPALPEQPELPQGDDEPEPAVDTTVSAPAAAAETETEPPESDTPDTSRRGRRKRASVPSWDDIVFGARKDD